MCASVVGICITSLCTFASVEGSGCGRLGVGDMSLLDGGGTELRRWGLVMYVSRKELGKKPKCPECGERLKFIGYKRNVLGGKTEAIYKCRKCNVVYYAYV